MPVDVRLDRVEHLNMDRQSTIRIGYSLAVILSLAGMAVSVVLLQHHLVTATGGEALLDNVCGITATASCDDVIVSEWGTVAGLPTALWGFFFFAALTAWFIAVGWPRGTLRLLNLIPTAATGVGFVGCVALAYIMYMTLENWCPLCTATHAITAVLFAVCVLLWVLPGRAVPANPGGSKHAPSGAAVGLTVRQCVLAVLLAAAIAGAGWSEYHRRLSEHQRDLYYARWQEYDKDYKGHYEQFVEQPKYDIPITDDDVVRGDPEAPHTVVVFSDFQCTHCRTAHHMIERKMEAHPGWFKVIFKHYPLNQQCNTEVQRTVYAASCAAAVSSEAARQLVGDAGFWHMHDAFYENQRQFPAQMQAFINEQAVELGIAPGDIWARIQTTGVWTRVHEHVAQARDLGVRATPRIFFDGRQMNRWADPYFWRYLKQVDDEAGRPVIPPGSPPPPPEPAPVEQPEEAQPDEN